MQNVDAGSKLPTWHPSHAWHPRPWRLHARGTPALLLQRLLHHPALLVLHECSSRRVLMETQLPRQSCKEAADRVRVGSAQLSYLGARQAPWMKQASKLSADTHHDGQG